MFKLSSTLITLAAANIHVEVGSNGEISDANVLLQVKSRQGNLGKLKQGGLMMRRNFNMAKNANSMSAARGLSSFVQRAAAAADQLEAGSAIVDGWETEEHFEQEKKHGHDCNDVCGGPMVGLYMENFVEAQGNNFNFDGAADCLACHAVECSDMQEPDECFECHKTTFDMFEGDLEPFYWRNVECMKSAACGWEEPEEDEHGDHYDHQGDLGEHFDDHYDHQGEHGDHYDHQGDLGDHFDDHYDHQGDLGDHYDHQGEHGDHHHLDGDTSYTTDGQESSDAGTVLAQNKARALAKLQQGPMTGNKKAKKSARKATKAAKKAAKKVHRASAAVDEFQSEHDDDHHHDDHIESEHAYDLDGEHADNDDHHHDDNIESKREHDYDLDGEHHHDDNIESEHDYHHHDDHIESELDYDLGGEHADHDDHHHPLDGEYYTTDGEASHTTDDHHHDDNIESEHDLDGEHADHDHHHDHHHDPTTDGQESSDAGTVLAQNKARALAKLQQGPMTGNKKAKKSARKVVNTVDRAAAVDVFQDDHLHDESEHDYDLDGEHADNDDHHDDHHDYDLDGEYHTTDAHHYGEEHIAQA